MTIDVEARLRADGEHWRRSQPSAAPLPLETALAAAVPGLDADRTAVVELTADPPPRRAGTHRRWAWAAAAAVVVLLAGAAAGVISTTRHAKGPTAAAAELVGTIWLVPGAGTNGAGTTLSFDPAATKLTISDGCTTSPYHVTVDRGTLRIGGVDGLMSACSPPARDPGQYPTAGDPGVAAGKALDAVTHGTVTWTVDDHTLILRRGAKTATLFATTSIGQRCAATEFTVTAAGTAHRYPLSARTATLTVKAPADIDAAATGPCRAAVVITLAPSNRPDAPVGHTRYGHWRVTKPGAYQLSLTQTVCTPAYGDCSFLLRPLQIAVQVNS